MNPLLDDVSHLPKVAVENDSVEKRLPRTSVENVVILQKELESLENGNQQTFNEVLHGYKNLMDDIDIRLRDPATPGVEKGVLVQQKKEYAVKMRELQTRFPEWCSVVKKQEERPVTEALSPVSSMELSEEFWAKRQERIRLEDIEQSKNPKDRERKCLDYIRRGRLLNNVEILPDILSLVPDILKKGFVDFSDENYNEKQVANFLIEEFKKVETVLSIENSTINDFFTSFDLIPKHSGIYLDKVWYDTKVLALFRAYEGPKGEKNPQSDQDYVLSQRKVLERKLREVLDGDVHALLTAYDANASLVNVSFPERALSSVSQYIFEKRTESGFVNYPKLSEYTGEVLKKKDIPNFVDKEPRPDLVMVKRDVVPDFRGGIILDGNFGYDDACQKVLPEDKIIVDHHDKFDEETHDTATIMAFNFIEDPKKMAMLESPQYLDENGKLMVMTNNIDSDSLFSTWVITNREKLLELRNTNKKEYQALKNIISGVTKAGDFLLGGNTLKYGVTPRDYEYIMRGYIKACRQKIINKRLGDELEKKESEMATLDFGMAQAILEGKRAVDALQKQKSVVEKTIAKLKEKMDKPSKDPFSLREDSLLIDHIHSVVEDIIKNPFKYYGFLEDSRVSEQVVISEVDAAYHEGVIDITPDEADSDILIVRPLKEKAIPRFASLDGEYFYFRRSEKFNRELIVTFDKKGSFMMAINTQNMKGLEEYDFNTLIDTLREKETEVINELIIQKKAELSTLVPGKDQKRIDGCTKELITLEEDKESNMRGRSWRSRTQMIFAFKTYISEKDLMEKVYVWKKENSNVN